MIYIIDGNEPYLIKNKLNEIVPFNDKNASIQSFNGFDNDFDYNQLVSYCESSNLFSEHNYVLVLNPKFLINTKKDNEKEYQNIINYCMNPNYYTDLILYTYENNFNKTSKVYKTIANNAEVINLNNLDNYNFKSYCRSVINDNKLVFTNESFNRLVNICDNSISLFMQNIELLKAYGNNIDEKCIDRLCTSEINNNIFDLINSLTSRNLSKAINILNDLYLSGNNAFYISASLAAQLRFLYQVDFYLSRKYSTKDICDILKCKEFRLQMASKSLDNLSRKKILNLLSSLSKLDELNKSDSSITPEARLELFIIKNFGKNYEK